jgi:hypothetical protein
MLLSRKLVIEANPINFFKPEEQKYRSERRLPKDALVL